jgi:chromosome segregation ATPase
MDQFGIMIENLKKECYANFLSQADKENIDGRIDVIMSRLREVEKKSSDNEEALEINKDHIRRHSEDINELKDALADLLAKLRSLEGRTDKNDRDIADIMDRLQQLTEKMRQLEDSVANSSTGDVEDLMKKLKELEKLINDKVDCDTFDNEIAALRAMIGNMDDGKGSQIQLSQAPPPRPAGPQLSTKDLNKIKEILEKFPGMEETQAKILK